MDPASTTTSTTTTTTAPPHTRATRAAARARAAETTATTAVPAPIPTAAVAVAKPGVHPTLPSVMPQPPTASGPAPSGSAVMTYEERLRHYGLIKIADNIFQEVAIEHRTGRRWFKPSAENLAALGLQEVSAGLYVKQPGSKPPPTATATTSAPPPTTSAPAGIAAMAPGGFNVEVTIPSERPAYSQGATDSPRHIPFRKS